MEINLIHGHPLDLADQAFLFKRTAREAALRHKMYATFMAKPHAKEPGSAMHIHQSIVDLKTRKNIFSNADGTPSQLFFSHIAGLQKYLPAAMALLCANVNSYRRLTPYLSAPINVHWGYDNRTAGLRVPMSNAEARRVENRVSGADANPYIAIATSLACGYLGMVEGLQPTDPITGSAHDLPFGLPRSLDEALRRLRESEAAGGLAGRGVHCGIFHRQGSRVRGISTGHQLLGARAPAAQRMISALRNGSLVHLLLAPLACGTGPAEPVALQAEIGHWSGGGR